MVCPRCTENSFRLADASKNAIHHVSLVELCESPMLRFKSYPGLGTELELVEFTAQSCVCFKSLCIQSAKVCYYYHGSFIYVMAKNQFSETDKSFFS